MAITRREALAMLGAAAGAAAVAAPLKTAKAQSTRAMAGAAGPGFCPVRRRKCRTDCAWFWPPEIVDQMQLDCDFAQGCSVWLLGGVVAHLALANRVRAGK